jgi:predicted MFS family arabinose efflux permease
VLRRSLGEGRDRNDDLGRRPKVEAAPETPGPGLPRGLLPLLTALVFVVFMDGRVMTAMLPEIADDLGTSIASAGLALTGYLLAYGVFQLAYGPLADRVGEVWVIAVVCVGFAVAVGLTALAPDIVALVGIRLVAGALAAAFFPLSLATVGSLVAYESRQSAIGALLAALALGQIFGAAVGGFVTEAFSWRVMFALDGVLALLLVAPLWRFRRATPPAPGRPGGRPLEAQRRLLRDRQATVIYAIVFVEGAAFFGGLGYLGALLHDEYGLSLNEVGLVLVLDGLGLLVTSRLLGRIAPRLGENRMILTGALFMGGAYLLVLVVANWQAVVPAAVLLGAGFALCHSTLQTRATELAPEAMATAISLFAFSLFVGSAAGTAVLGQLVESRGYGALLLSCGVALALLGVAAPRLTAPPSATSQ